MQVGYTGRCKCRESRQVFIHLMNDCNSLDAGFRWQAFIPSRMNGSRFTYRIASDGSRLLLATIESFPTGHWMPTSRYTGWKYPNPTACRETLNPLTYNRPAANGENLHSPPVYACWPRVATRVDYYTQLLGVVLNGWCYSNYYDYINGQYSMPSVQPQDLSRSRRQYRRTMCELPLANTREIIKRCL